MKPIIRIISYSAKLWKLYVLIAVFTVILALLNQATPLLTKMVIDAIVAGLNGGEVAATGVALLVFLIFAADVGSTLLDNVSGYYGDMMGVRLQKLLARRYYKHLLKLPQTYFDNELTGTIISRLNRGVTEISSFMNMFANNFFQFLLSTVFSLVIVAYYSWEVALMLGILYPVFLYMTRRTSAAWQIDQAVINQDTDVASGRFAEVIGQIPVVKSFTQERAELRTLNQRYRNMVRVRRKQSVVWHKHDIYRRLVLNLVFFAVYAYVIWQTVTGRFSIGEMVLLLQYATFIRIPIFSMSFLVDNTQHAIANSKDYFEVMDTPVTITDKPGAKRLRVNQGQIEYRQVAFGYNQDKQVLRDVSFIIKPGSKVALVGESGEGKSTIANLLLRLYEPTSGQILIDSQYVSEVTQASLRRQVGVVFQAPSLFSGTIAENITYSNSSASKRAMTEAAQAANAHDFIMQLPKGYQTDIGERGLRLSGGQKQRIAIARALLKNPPILILDEATSSLDSKAEVLVQEALERLMKGRTTLIIAHRLSTIKDADMVVGIKNGKVAESGSPRQLARQGGIYAELLRLQTAATPTRKRKLKQYDLVTS